MYLLVFWCFGGACGTKEINNLCLCVFQLHHISLEGGEEKKKLEHDTYGLYSVEKGSCIYNPMRI